MKYNLEFDQKNGKVIIKSLINGELSKVQAYKELVLLCDGQQKKIIKWLNKEIDFKISIDNFEPINVFEF